ncbi:nucleotide disphospho-sugar-binding domain-containing protein [Kitasatospora sp. NPDC094011]|uniref:nucleotide disphospho-sugar-binding domain-containing protein n=1 Tax=Kitasatospora sp. NPDC094011 TaxID=3364090 RepID=UPI00381F5873
MRVLLITSPVATHLMPMVPLAWALRAAGHDVLVVGQPDVLGVARQAGLEAVAVGDRFRIDELTMRRLRPGERPLESLGRPTAELFGTFPPTWRQHSEAVLPRYLDLARRYRPQLVLADVMEVNSLAVGALLGVPVAQHRFGVDPVSAPVREGARRALAGLCAGLGLDRLPDPDLLIDPCPPQLQLPDLEPALPIRFVPFNGSGEVPDWVVDRRAGQRARFRVAVSLGVRTLALNGVPFVRRLLGSFEALPEVEVLATVDAGYRAELGPLPAGVRLIDPVPLHLLADSCDVVVHHGGAGSVLTASARGVPQLALPQFADQFAHGDRLAAVGAGLTLDDVRGQDDPERVVEAVDELLTDPDYTERAGRLRDWIAQSPAPAEVVTELVRRL